MSPPLGIIAGHFGKRYSWSDQTHLMQTVAGSDYTFHHYAPKGDVFLWTVPLYAKSSRGWMAAI